MSANNKSVRSLRGTFFRRQHLYAHMFAGFVLATAGLVAGAQQGEVGDKTLWLLGVACVATVLVLHMAMTVFISRANHGDKLRQLAPAQGAHSR